MTFRRFLAHGFLVIYVTLTFLALCYTMVRWKPLGFTVIFPTYGMMAPYQGYAREHRELIAEGKKPDGTWERINIRPYYPGRRGEGAVRQQMRLVEWMFGSDALMEAYKTLARRIQNMENESPRDYSYESVRLSWEVWPVSIEEFEQFRHPPFTRIVPVVSIP